MEPILIVMAAGLGSRYGGNKQIDPVSGEGDIIMDFSLFDAMRAGFKRVIFVIKKELEDELRAHIDNGAGKFMRCEYVLQSLNDIPETFTVPEERTKPWGTGHAVYAARNFTDAPFAVINADDYYGLEAFELIYDFLKYRASATRHCMVSFLVENTLSPNGTVSRGICREEDGKLSDIEEHFEVARECKGTYKGVITGVNTLGESDIIPDGTPVSMNLWGFGSEYMEVLASDLNNALEGILKNDPLNGEFYLPSSINNHINAGDATVEILHSSDRWFGVTYKDDKPIVEATISEMKRAEIYPRQLWEIPKRRG